MAKKKSVSFFWVSYSDMMTSLFFIMLILFVLSVSGMYLKGVANQKELDRIHELDEAVNRLPRDFFIPDTINKRWVLKEEYMPHFASKQAIIPESDHPKLVRVGKAIQTLIENLSEMKNDERYANMDVKYLVLIEGMASNIAYEKNDELSYNRALALYNLWKENGIDFESSECQVQISGSGTRGIRPYNREFYNAQKQKLSNAGEYYSLKEEEKNQCIIIQIIPKISNK